MRPHSRSAAPPCRKWLAASFLGLRVGGGAPTAGNALDIPECGAVELAFKTGGRRRAGGLQLKNGLHGLHGRCPCWVNPLELWKSRQGRLPWRGTLVGGDPGTMRRHPRGRNGVGTPSSESLFVRWAFVHGGCGQTAGQRLGLLPSWLCRRWCSAGTSRRARVGSRTGSLNTVLKARAFSGGGLLL